MAEYFQVEGVKYLNSLLANKDTPTDMVFRIYTNQVDLDALKTESDFTELDHPDYSPYVTSSADWEQPNDGILSHPEVEWQLTSGGVDIVGFYIVADGILIFAGEFKEDGSPYSVNDAGAIIRASYSHNIGL